MTQLSCNPLYRFRANSDQPVQAVWPGSDLWANRCPDDPWKVTASALLGHSPIPLAPSLHWEHQSDTPRKGHSGTMSTQSPGVKSHQGQLECCRIPEAGHIPKDQLQSTLLVRHRRSQWCEEERKWKLLVTKPSHFFERSGKWCKLSGDPWQSQSDSFINRQD